MLVSILTSGHSKYLFHSGFQTIILHIFLISTMCVTCLAHLNNICWIEQIMKLITVRLFCLKRGISKLMDIFRQDERNTHLPPVR
jgi:quinol-cytochrome oxidoreductase complex cytochrome b subunit